MTDIHPETTRPSDLAAHRPLIVTARMAPAAQLFFDRLRKQHFPAERNWIDAHITLFHALPGTERQPIADILAAEAQGTMPLPITVSEVSKTGRGVAYALCGQELIRVRSRLAGRFTDWLTPQDRQRFRPHVTVQNKVAPDVARALHADLSQGFTPWEFAVTGLDLWHYCGGPWHHAEAFSFKAA